MDILKSIEEKLPGKINEAGFEGANIVLYTDSEKFFKEGDDDAKILVLLFLAAYSSFYS